MIVLLDTSAPLVRLTLIDGNVQYDHDWQADRSLARNLHAWLRDRLADHGRTWEDIDGIGAFAGPGSFTGLRIGLSVLNALADSLPAPIVAVSGDEWRQTALRRLAAGDNDRIALPVYDRPAAITQPRK